MRHIIVIGNGMVGYKFCEKLRKLASPEQLAVTVFGEEPRPAYDRVHLSEYFSDQNADKLCLAPLDWYAQQQIDLHTGELVAWIDRRNKIIETHRGKTLTYDQLVIATGSSAFVPPVPGTDKRGVFVYRTIEDLEATIAYGKKVKSVAVMGGGLLGLEAAKAMVDMELETHVVEFASRLMPRQLDEAGARTLQTRIEELGIQVHLNKNTQSISGNGKLDGLHFADGSVLSVDMLVVSAGIRPRDELARSSGLEVGARGGIVVNDFMQTSDPNIYAIGEVALHQEMIYGLVAPGYDMANVAAHHLLGETEKCFAGNDMSTKLKLMGVDVASFGDVFGAKSEHRAIVFEDKVKSIYKRINVTPDGKQLLGGMLVGDAEAYNMLQQTMQNGVALPPNPEGLILGSRGGESAGVGLDSLPDDAQVCSCEGVTKGMIYEVVLSGEAQSVKEIKACTKAGTGCGGCMPMVSDLFDLAQAKMGKRVRKVICEHFDYTRQELLDIIQVKEIRSYDELLNKCGTGDGCEVCKPAVASILASLWNDLVTKQDTIQDIN
ncbi:MAG: nitrite reductase large subunit NirB, partial [Bacteroidota bacterium]